LNNSTPVVIEDIVITEEKRTELNKILESHKYSHFMKVRAIKDTLGGPCSVCGSLPTKNVKFDIGDSDGPAELIERYCDKCFIRLRATNGKDETIAVRNDTKSINSRGKMIRK
jgi:hypothetical protein